MKSLKSPIDIPDPCLQATGLLLHFAPKQCLIKGHHTKLLNQLSFKYELNNFTRRKALNILSIDWEISNPIHWCPCSDSVSPLRPDPQPPQRKEKNHHHIENTRLIDKLIYKAAANLPMSSNSLGTPSSGRASSSNALSESLAYQIFQSYPQKQLSYTPNYIAMHNKQQQQFSIKITTRK